MRTASGIRVYKLNAYAKLNLYLDITGRRDDGYHLLETVMQLSLIHISEPTRPY